MRQIGFLSAATVFSVGIGCGGNPEIPKAGPASGADQASVQAMSDKADAAKNAMTDKSQLETVIAQYEAIFAVAPTHRPTLLNLAMLYNMDAYNVIPEKERDRRLATYLKGREMGLRAVALNPDFKAAYEKDNDIIKALPTLKAEDMPGLYWMALNWAEWGEIYGIIRAAIDIPKVHAAMDKINQLAPDFYAHAADRFFIGYWIAIPGFAGKDAKKSLAAFERTQTGDTAFLDNFVTYARYYAVDTENKQLFTDTLQKVVSAPAEAADYPFRLQNLLARDDAKRWLAKTKDIFE